MLLYESYLFSVCYLCVIFRYYVKHKNGRLQNAPYVDNSYKWAGGGFISSASDLVKYANAMLYSYQNNDDNSTSLRGYLRPETVRALWSEVKNTKCGWDKDGGSYGMGWGVMPKIEKYGHALYRPFYVSHTGGAIGASSVLLVLPRDESMAADQQVAALPQGVSIAIITNIQGVNLNPLALDIAKLFEQL